MRRALQRPLCSLQLIARKIRSGLDESTHVQRQTSIEPLRTRFGAGHHENVPDVVALCRVLVGPPPDALEIFRSVEGRELRARVQGNLRALFYAPYQIP